jgi:hypothetical protein
MATITYKGLSGVRGTLTVNTTDTLTTITNAIIADEGLTSAWYANFILDRDSSITLADNASDTYADLGLTSTDMLIAILDDSPTTYTKEERQTQKLDIAAVKRAADGNARIVYDISELPTKYSGNTVVDNPNTGGLQQGRPWSTTEVPTLFSGLAIWYDTATASTINGGTFSDGTTLATLTNRATGTNAASLSGREPTVQNGAGDTLNGYPVIRFATAGTYDAVTFSTTAFANATGWTVTTLAKLAYTAGFNPYIFEIANSSLATLNVVRYFATAPGYFSVIGGASGSASVTSSVDPDDTWKIVTVRYDSTAAAASRITFRWDKTARTVTNGTTPNGAVASTADRINSMGAWNGDLAEQVIYNRALSDAEIIALENYLSSKWGV